MGCRNTLDMSQKQHARSQARTTPYQQTFHEHIAVTKTVGTERKGGKAFINEYDAPEPKRFETPLPGHFSVVHPGAARSTPL